MRTLHVIPYMHPSAGGPPVVVENFVREMRRLGHQSEIISTPLFCSDDIAALLQRLNKLAPTRFLSCVGPLSPLHERTRRQIGESVRAADITHLHTLWSPLNTIVRLECARYGRPYVLMPHGMLDPYSLKVKRWRKAIYLRTIERRNIQSAQCVLYTTAEEERLAAAGGLSIPKGVVIPLGGDAPAGNPAILAAGFLERFPKANGRRQILFLGRLHFKKGLDRILGALPAVVRAFPDVILTIVGDGSPTFETDLKRAITSRGLEKSVLFTGRLEGALKWGAYATAEVFLLPSRQENFAITVAEAMHMGLPVIVSDRVNTWPYVKGAGAGIILDEEKIEVGLEAAIISMLQDCGLRRSMGQRGREYARGTLTWAGATTSLLKCYEDVLACGRFGNLS